MKILAVIPARCNSQRIRHKNVALIGDKPMIQWTISAANQSENLTHIVSCTDCEHISGIMRIRPSSHDFDNGEASDAVVSTLRYYRERRFDLVVMLLPTSPFRTGQQIDEAIESFLRDDADSLISVSPISTEPRKLRWVEDFMRVKRLRPLTAEVICESNGAIQITRPHHLLKYASFHAGDVMPYMMDRETGLDIDTPEDMAKARQIAMRMLDVRVQA